MPYFFPFRALFNVRPPMEAKLTQQHRELLESCYHSCLELAENNGVESIAFCCISTGVFGFPQKEAAEIAFNTVKQYFKENNKIRKLVFNVFESSDYQIYRQLLGADK